MKVLHLISSGGFFGAERVVLTLASRKDSNAYWVGALNNFQNPHLEIIQEAKAIGLKTAVFDSKSQFDLATIFSVRRFLRENKIDIVHTHNFKSNFIGLWSTRFTDTQWVSTNHNWDIIDYKMRLYEVIDLFVLRFSKMVFTVSQEIKAGMIGKGFKESHVHVIHNGINVSQFDHDLPRAKLRDEWKVLDNDILLTIVGRLAPEKGHAYLFKALSVVVRKHAYVKCVVIGDGPLRSDLEGLVSSLGLSEHVIFAGIRKDMPEVYASCDIMINASFIEGLSMTVLEAMASKLPVIATRVGGTPQVIQNEKNGLLLDPGDVSLLADAINRLIENPQMRKQFSTQAYLNVTDSFSDRIMSEKYIQFYEIALVNR